MSKKLKIGDVERGDEIQVNLEKEEGEKTLEGTVNNVKPHMNHNTIRILYVETEDYENLKLKLFKSDSAERASVELRPGGEEFPASFELV